MIFTAPCVDSPLHLTTASEEQAWNFEQLARPVAEPRYRIWTYDQAALVLGHLRMPTSGRPRHGSRLPIKRQSGGGAVLVGAWLVSVSVALPRDHRLAARGVVDCYRWLGEAHASALRSFGIDASAVSPNDIRDHRVNESPDLQWACFGSLSPWEVAANARRKIVGLAQERRRNGVLIVAGTLISPPDWRLFTEWMDQPEALADRLADCTTNCESELGHKIDAMDFANRLKEEIASQLNEGSQPGSDAKYLTALAS